MSDIIDKLAFLYWRNGKILSTLSKGRTKFYIPGGKREGGESDIEALSREIQEELSVELLRDTLSYVGTFTAQADSHPEGVQVQMTCYTGEFEGELVAASEIERIVWLSYADREKTSPVDQLIFDWLKERNILG